MTSKAELSVRNRTPIAYRPIKVNEKYIEDVAVYFNVSKTKAVDLLVSLAREKLGDYKQASVETRLDATV